MVTWCFDELQVVAGCERFIRLWLDTEKVEVFLSGSAAALLSREIATAMRGRVWGRASLTIAHSKFLVGRTDGDVDMPLQRSTRMQLSNATREHWLRSRWPSRLTGAAQSPVLAPGSVHWRRADRGPKSRLESVWTTIDENEATH
jgi:hypothetical protein